MGRNSRLKWERREARWKQKAEMGEARQKAKDKFENVDTDNMTPEQLHKHFKDTMDDSMGLDYLVGKAIKEKNQGMLQMISNYKQTGYLPPVTMLKDDSKKEEKMQVQ